MTATVITAADALQLMKRAEAASNTNQAIIAVVDRNGTILGVREEQGVLNTFAGEAAPGSAAYNQLNVFAIDGAVAEARTAALFSSGAQALTSRTVQEISQSTITQREVQSNSDIMDPTSTVAGPGLVAPIGLGGHFPPGVPSTDSADLFQIELTNRDGTTPAGTERFNIPLANVSTTMSTDGAANQLLTAPVSYGVQSGILPTAQVRGIGTLPGGIPLYKNGVLVGGIGVFFPGTKGYADFEQGFVAGIGQTESQRVNAPLEELAEWMAFAASGQTNVGAVAAPVPGYGIPAAANKPINLGGILLDSVGPNGPYVGAQTIANVGAHAGRTTVLTGVNQPIDPAMDLSQAGKPVPDGWLVTPHAGSTLSAAQVSLMIYDGMQAAFNTRAQLRPLGSSASMVFAVADKDGSILGLYRMQDATVFSIDVAVAKARNTAYYANPALLNPADQISGETAGTAFSNRTFRDLA